MCVSDARESLAATSRYDLVRLRILHNAGSGE